MGYGVLCPWPSSTVFTPKPQNQIGWSMQVFLLSTHISIISFYPIRLGPLDAAAQVAEPPGGV